MLAVATQAIKDIRERAGAEPLNGNLTASNESRDIVRKERRKELAFENKTKWDLRRWRVNHDEGRDGFWGIQRDKNLFSNNVNYRFRGIYPFYSTKDKKWFFDVRFQYVSEKTFGLINQLIDDVSDKQFMLINALAIDMEWNNLIQATSATMRNSYSVNYAHERYSAYIPFINGDDYGTVKFNNDTINAKAVEIGASINNYDIVNTLGEENIRATITEEYQKWLNSADRYNCSGEIEENVEAYVNQYIEELDSNYQQVKGSTDFKMYVDDSVKMFAKELKEYNGTSLEYIGIMPQNQTLSDFIKNTNATTLSQMMDQLKTIESRNFEEGKITKITGGIPLFQYEYELNLMSDLKNLGVTDVFDESKADLSGITDDENIVIADAKHKANIEFSNEGIKASAATSMSGAGGAGCGFEYLYEVPVVEIDLTFDNPYLYIIRDKNSKEVWFIGTVYQPTVNTNNNARVINGNQ